MNSKKKEIENFVADNASQNQMQGIPSTAERTATDTIWNRQRH